jgi:hypothetical protein
MLIIKNGTEAYMKEERRHHHHRLEELAEIVPDINQKDRAILRNLSRFVAWAGRYPDPGAGRLKDVEEIFAEAELHRVSASDLFHLAGRVMAYARKVVG